MEEDASSFMVQASYILMLNEIDFTIAGFEKTIHIILSHYERTRTSRSGNVRMQVSLLPLISIENMSKYRFVKKGGMTTGWYKPEDWRQLDEAAMRILQRIVSNGWDIQDVHIHATYEKERHYRGGGN